MSQTDYICPLYYYCFVCPYQSSCIFLSNHVNQWNISQLSTAPKIHSLDKKDPLVGIWERYGDNSAGTIIRVSKVNDSYEGVLEIVAGRLNSCHFKVGQKKWHEVKFDNNSIYTGKDTIGYEEKELFEKTNMKLYITRDGILKLDSEKKTEFGQHQTWRKLTDIPTTLSPKQRTELISAGFPPNYPSSIDSYYNIWLASKYKIIVNDKTDRIFKSFKSFVNDMAECTNKEKAKKLASHNIVARGLYSEVSNHGKDGLIELDYISDCLMNRVEKNNTKWPTYKIAAQLEGLNCINPNSSEYWVGAPVQEPLVDSSGSDHTRRSLIKAYYLACTHVGYIYPANNNRHSDLETDLFYFEENTKKPYKRKIGFFYFRKTY